MDKIIINQLKINTIIGMRDAERLIAQPVILTITVFLRKRMRSQKDNLNYCLDYSLLNTELQERILAAHFYTIEALAEEVARICLAKKQARKVIVRIDKPLAIPDAVSAAIEIKRRKWLYL